MFVVSCCPPQPSCSVAQQQSVTRMRLYDACFAELRRRSVVKPAVRPPVRVQYASSGAWQQKARARTRTCGIRLAPQSCIDGEALGCKRGAHSVLAAVGGCSLLLPRCAVVFLAAQHSPRRSPRQAQWTRREMEEADQYSTPRDPVAPTRQSPSPALVTLLLPSLC